MHNTFSLVGMGSEAEGQCLCTLDCCCAAVHRIKTAFLGVEVNKNENICDNGGFCINVAL